MTLKQYLLRLLKKKKDMNKEKEPSIDFLFHLLPFTKQHQGGSFKGA